MTMSEKREQGARALMASCSSRAEAHPSGATSTATSPASEIRTSERRLVSLVSEIQLLNVINKCEKDSSEKSGQKPTTTANCQFIKKGKRRLCGEECLVCIRKCWGLGSPSSCVSSPCEMNLPLFPEDVAEVPEIQLHQRGW